MSHQHPHAPPSYPKRRSVPSHSVVIATIADIDGSIIWHYGECECGWESKSWRLETDARQEGADHVTKEHP